MNLKEKLRLAESRLSFLAVCRDAGRPICESPGCCLSPLREEKRPSFCWWFNQDGRARWKDFGSGESGDCVAMLAKLRGLTNKKAICLYLEMAGVSDTDSGPLPALKPIAPKPILPVALKPKPTLPQDIHPGTISEIAELLTLRGWDVPVAYLHEVSELEILRFGTWQGQRAWFLVDPAGRFFEARKLEGGLWPNGAKSDTRGSKSLLGAESLKPGCLALLVEGVPDFLACHIYKHEARKRNIIFNEEAVPVAMFGGTGRLKEEDLTKFKGVRVIIFAHLDTQGRQARDNWKAQVRKAGAFVSDIPLSRFVHPKGKDLSDTLDPWPKYELLQSIKGKDEQLREESK